MWPLSFHGPGLRTRFSKCLPSAGNRESPRFLDKGLEWHLTLLCSHLLCLAWGLLSAGGLLGSLPSRGGDEDVGSKDSAWGLGAGRMCLNPTSTPG